MRFKPSRAIYLPADAAEVDPSEYGNVPGVTFFRKAYPDGKLQELCFFGKQSKPYYNYIYRPGQEELAKKTRERVIESAKAHEKYKNDQKASRKAFKPSLKVGDVMMTCWGYDQTNREFFQVIEIKPSGKSVVVRSIGTETVEGGGGPMSANVRPVKDDFFGEPLTKRILPGNRIAIGDSYTRYASVCDPVKDYYVSWYA